MPATIEFSHKLITDAAELDQFNVDDPVVVIYAQPTCSCVGTQKPIQVATLFEINNSNPTLTLNNVANPIGLLEKIIAYVREKPWVEPEFHPDFFVLENTNDSDIKIVACTNLGAAGQALPTYYEHLGTLFEFCMIEPMKDRDAGKFSTKFSIRRTSISAHAVKSVKIR